MTHPALSTLTQFMLTLAAIPDAEMQRFLPLVELKTYAPNTYFTRDGDHHDRVGFVNRGLFRVYYTSSDGEMHIRNFCKEGAPIGSYATILRGAPAHVSIESIEESLVAQFSFRDLAQLFDQHPAWERLGRRLAEEHYISRERREHHLLTLDAAARYEQFRQDFPGLDARTTQANIASYIGVSPETLSRIIKKIRS